MTNQQILERAISKAIDSGWQINLDKWEVLPTLYIEGLFGPEGGQTLIEHYYTFFIFNHDFCKAIWGDKFINPEMRDDTGSKVIAIKRTSWKFHLQQMVIADDPIKYLGEHI